ncbi:MAG: bifunctional biotin--[acetyl-CoA-carboxylase] ligase/biotin operon repressor BirA [Gammaproteobacteria bacterium]
MRRTHHNLYNLLKILNDGQIHDGTGIGETLGLTRSAVWKAIKKLEQYDIPIESIKGKGYCLAEPLILLEEEKILSHLSNTQDISIDIFETIRSTNDYFKTNTPGTPFSFCFAEMQTQGRGRLNREWHSPFGKNLYMTCHYQFNRDISALAGLSLAIGLAVFQAIKIQGIDDLLKVKWPNDILYQQKKLAGILIEINAESHGACHANIGIGMNVNSAIEKTLSITQPWTSLSEITQNTFDRNVLAANLIEQIIHHIQTFESSGLTKFVDIWKKHDALIHQPITLIQNTKKITGQGVGIDQHGNLLLKLSKNEIQAFSSGDVSIQKQ